MAKRPKPRQNVHNREVKRIASQLRKKGWNVRADLPNHEKPEPIGKDNRTPDIEATKRGHRKIIEVETPDTVAKDKKQAETFRRHAAQKPNTTFDVVVTDD